MKADAVSLASQDMASRKFAGAVRTMNRGTSAEGDS